MGHISTSVFTSSTLSAVLSTFEVQLINVNKKSELMLTRCAKAYSSFGSVV